MENNQQLTLFPQPVKPAATIKRKPATPAPQIAVYKRSGEPKSIGQLMEPIQAIIEHPDRNRIMAEFFRRFW